MADTETVSRRHAATLDRDEQVVKLLSRKAKPLNELVEALGLPRSQVYSCLWRLRAQGRVEKVRDGSRVPLWQLTAVSDT